MRTWNRRVLAGLFCLGAAGLGGPALLAGGHTWAVNQIFSNADGTIQYIMIWETGGGSMEWGIGAHFIASNTRSNWTKYATNWLSGLDSPDFQYRDDNGVY